MMLNDTKKSSKKKKLKKSAKRPRSSSNHTAGQSPVKSKSSSKGSGVRKLSPGTDLTRRSLSAKSDNNNI